MSYTDTSALNAFVNGSYATFVTNTNTAIAGKITTFYQASAPTANVTGDLWIDTDDGNKLYRWNGSAWTSVQDTAIQSALTAASNAQTTADGKIVTFAQTSAPTATDVGDLWIDTDDNNKMYRWDGSSWVPYTDTSALNTFDASLDQQEIFKRLTDDGHLPGIFMNNGQLYINASYIAAGILADASGNTSWNLTTGALSSKIFSIDSTNITLDNGSITLGDFKIGENNTTRYYRRIVIGDGAIVTKNVTQSINDAESTDIHDSTKTVATIGTLSSTTAYPGSTNIAIGTGLSSANNLVLEATGNAYLNASNGVEIKGSGVNIQSTGSSSFFNLYAHSNRWVSLGPRVRIDGDLQVSNGRSGVYQQWLNGASVDIEIGGKVASFKNGVLVSYS